MEIKHVDNESKGFFRATEDGIDAGKITYSWAGDKRIIVDHTEVEQAFNGRGVGKAILMEIVAFARSKDIKILPLCPFAKSVFDKTPEISDVKA